MQIAIDAHMVGEQETGNETYTLNLIKGLLRVTGRDPKGFSWDPGAGAFEEANAAAEQKGPRRWGAIPRFHLLATHPERLRAALTGIGSGYGSGDLPLNASIHQVRPANALLRIPLAMPWLSARRGFDLLHVNYNAPPLSPCPTVITIHDISFEHYPQFFSPRDLLILKTLVPLSARRAARIITVSRHAKQEIIERYRIPAEKIAVTYEAAGPQFRPVTDREQLGALRRKYGIGRGPFILALGNLQPRKNIGRLVEAFGQITSNKLQAPLPSPKLVIAGKAQWRESDIFQAVAAAGLEDCVIFPGYIDDADLPALFSAAAVFVYPSLYEGFGLPPLEAMACGAPVICSNIASLPEVVSDAALTIDPTDTEMLAQTLVDVLTDPGLQAELRKRGLRRAAQFSWDRCAAETLAVYAEIYAMRAKQ